MNKTNLSYNQHKRKWELRGEINELLQDFPAGPEGQRDGIIAQLEIEAPRAITLALTIERTLPTVQGRALRAAQLIAAHAVINSSRPNCWRVRSQRHPRDLYTTHLLTDGRWHCSCTDWMRGESGASNGAPWLHNNGQESPICKHIIAVLFHNRIRATVQPWPPACPNCEKTMRVKRQTNDGSGLPFFSCSNFPHCKGRREFQAHPDDLASAQGSRDALYLSMERAQKTGLVDVAIAARRRASSRELVQEYTQLINSGTDPTSAAELVDADCMSFEEWCSHHRQQPWEEE